MSETGWIERGLATEEQEQRYSELSDAEIARRMREKAVIADLAVQEFRRRHLVAVAAYARLCTNDRYAALHLADEALNTVAGEASAGIDPPGTWRHRAMVLVQQIATAWLAGGLDAQLDPAFVAWLRGAGAEVADPSAPEISPFARDAAVLRGFYSLTEGMRTVLWYSLVEQEPDASVAIWLGIKRDEVEGLRDRAMRAMREAFLHSYLQGQGGGSCVSFQRIIEAAARPGSTRCNEDFIRHLERCPTCAMAMSELTRIWKEPRTALTEGLLRWGSAAYGAPTTPAPDLVTAPTPWPAGADPAGRTTTIDLSAPAAAWRPPRKHRQERLPRRSLLAPLSLALALLTATGTGMALTLLAASHGLPKASGRHNAVPAPLRPVATLTPTATAPAVTVTPTATAHPVTLTPTATGSDRPSAPAPSTTMTPLPPIGGYGIGATGVVQALGAGRCLDVPDFSTSPGTQLQIWNCNGGANQIWSYTASHQLTVYTDGHELCLAVHGRDITPGTEVQTWYCDGQPDQQWTINPDGTITSAGSGLCLDVTGGSTDEGARLDVWSCNGGSNQQWNLNEGG